MNNPCPYEPDRFWQQAAQADPLLEAHIQECSDCRARAERARKGLAALQALQPQRAPARLDGAVVAALHAGARQERVLVHLSAMERQAAPPELDAQIERGLLWPKGPDAPAELDSLVDADLAAPSETMSRRFLGKLDRLQAPDDLEERLVVRPTRASRQRAFALVGALLLLIGMGSLAIQRWSADAAVVPQTRVAVQWNIEVVENAEDLDPIARALIGGLSGGASEVLGKEKL